MWKPGYEVVFIIRRKGRVHNFAVFIPAFQFICNFWQTFHTVCRVVYLTSHWGVQQILVYSWARPPILAAGKFRGGMFLFLLFFFVFFFTFIPVPLSSMSFSFLSSTVSSISFLPFSGRWHKMTHKGWRVVKPTQSIYCMNLSQWA